ncbi:fungal-type potassium/sodium efflux P-type ATPase [Limtongia smithiae]|uniref:fungal-type potassium/sodium efflux P-type ATPase n=1 Tax=Limtongia smithiae TaxID=1125753 RepID=UPI0034CE3B03
MVNTSSASEANDPPESSAGICGSSSPPPPPADPDCDPADDPPSPHSHPAEKPHSSAPDHVHHHRHLAASAPPHVVPADALAALFQSSLDNGITQPAASARLASDGKNVLETEAGVSLLSLFIRQVSNSLTLVLLIALALSYGTKDYIEGGVITAVILLNVVIGFVQDYKAEKTMQSLLSLSAPVASAVRDGQIVKVAAQDLVVGDIVKIKVGDVVPADLRLFEGMNLECDEALLTGESLAVVKTPYVTFEDPGIPIGDRTNVCYSSSTVTKGRATGIVVSTGMRTEVGKIAQLLNSKDGIVPSVNADGTSSVSSASTTFSAKMTRRLHNAVYTLKNMLGLIGTPLQVKLSKFALLLFALAILLAIIVFSASKWQINNDVLIYGICVAVAVIPESLIAVLTITLSVATKAMAKGHVLVRRMSSLEALGGVTDICSDKTGTLTQGKMITHRVWIPGYSGRAITVVDTASPFSPQSGFMQVDGQRLEATGILQREGSAALRIFLNAIGLCNIATVEMKADTTPVKNEKMPAQSGTVEWTGHGEPTEISLQVFSMRFDNGRSDLEARGWKLLNEHPFDSSIKRMSVVYESPEGKRFVFAKGAVESLLSVIDAEPALQSTIHREVSEMAKGGLRVLCVAYRMVPDETIADFNIRADVEQHLQFIGLAGLYDPPRVETRGAVLKAQRAGVTVHMLTGDHPATAQAIAYETAILSPDTNVATAVMVASQFDEMTDAEVDALPQLPLVIARCAPSTKVRMVEALHRRRAFCVMTGDGVNDSPALKRADVGIAMGLNGSDVAKDASDMILTDDDFASIVRAIEEGRRLFDNIQKFLMHLLISNISQVILLLCGLAFKDSDGNSVFPLSPLEILWVNMVTSSFLAMGLGVEEAQPDIMLRPPHDLNVGVFTWEVITDKMIYGTTMGVLCLVSFVAVIYGGNNGDLGSNCNDGYNDTCDAVFRARSVAFADLSLLLLITAWEVKHFARSLFNLDPLRFKGPFSIFPALYYNKFLFWAVMAGLVYTFPVIYIPVINKDVFYHINITWEWGVVAAACVIYLAVVESWKAIKRHFKIWSGKTMLTEEVFLEMEQLGFDPLAASPASSISTSTSVIVVENASDNGSIKGQSFNKRVDSLVNTRKVREK